MLCRIKDECTMLCGSCVLSLLIGRQTDAVMSRFWVRLGVWMGSMEQTDEQNSS